MPHGAFQLDCIHCKHAIQFAMDDLNGPVSCPQCQKAYGFGEETLRRQLTAFANLCQQIRASEEILGNAAVAVDVGTHNVRIPFKLLLCRLKSSLDLTIAGQRHQITFRVEPTRENV